MLFSLFVFLMNMIQSILKFLDNKIFCVLKHYEIIDVWFRKNSIFNLNLIRWIHPNPRFSHSCWRNASLVDHHHFLSLVKLGQIIEPCCLWTPSNFFPLPWCPLCHSNSLPVISEMGDLTSPSTFGLFGGLDYVFDSSLLLNPGVAIPVM